MKKTPAPPFSGYQKTVVAVAWMGYDTPRSLGSRASGSALALPAWIDYMATALKGVAHAGQAAPPEVRRSREVPPARAPRARAICDKAVFMIFLLWSFIVAYQIGRL